MWQTHSREDTPCEVPGITEGVNSPIVLEILEDGCPSWDIGQVLKLQREIRRDLCILNESQVAMRLVVDSIQQTVMTFAVGPSTSSGIANGGSVSWAPSGLAPTWSRDTIVRSAGMQESTSSSTLAKSNQLATQHEELLTSRVSTSRSQISVLGSESRSRRGASLSGWPASVEKRSVPDVEEYDSAAIESVLDGDVQFMSNELMAVDDDEMLEQVKNWRQAPWVRSFVLHPSSRRRAVLDLCSFIILCADLLLVPYIIAWGDIIDEGVRKSTIISLVFWTLDIPLHFRTGFYKHGELEMRPAAIAVKYLKSSFVIDLALVFADWIDMLLQFLPSDSSVDATNFWKLGRMMKVMRILRLVNVMRLSRSLEQLNRIPNQMLSEIVHNLVNMLLLLMTIIWVNHVLACTWIAIARYCPSDTGLHWTSSVVSGESLDTYEQSSILFQYSTAVHWSFTQMTPGSMPVQPLNSIERLFNICCLVMGLLFFTSVISSMSAKMTQLRMETNKRDTAMGQLDAFLRQKSVQGEIALNVKKQVEQRLGQRKPMMEKDLPVLNLLSETLQKELKIELRRGHLLHHQLFRVLDQVDRQTVEEICCRATSFAVFLAEDSVFVQGKEATAANFIVSGRVRYTQQPQLSVVAESKQFNLGEKSWLCWAALWVQWQHVGTAETTSSAELLVLDADAFIAVVFQHVRLRSFCAEYMELLHRKITTGHLPLLPNDIEVPFSDFAEIVCMMRRTSQSLVGMMALQSKMARSWNRAHSTQTVAKLAQELQSGKCTLVENTSGEIDRIVAITALRVENADDRILVCLADWHEEDHSFSPGVKLPGVKQKATELPQDALQRIQDGFFRGFVLSIESSERADYTQVSRQFRIRTKYLRTIYSATWDSDQTPQRVSLPASFNRDVTGLTDGHQESTVHDLPLQADCFILGNDKKRTICAWVRPETLEVLQSRTHERALQRWVLDFNAAQEPLSGRVSVRSSLSQPGSYVRQKVSR